MPAVAKTPSIDLGDSWPDTSEEEVPFVEVGPIWGRRWKVLQSVNTFTALEADTNPAVYTTLVANAIHPDERQAFLDKLRSQKDLANPERLMELINMIVNAAAGNPTNSSSGSSTGTPKKAAASRSAAASGRRVTTRTR